jgi:hypothetical protein
MTYGALKGRSKTVQPGLGVEPVWRRVGETTDYSQKSANHQTFAKK